MTHEIVVAAHDSSLPHQDPADRFLAATVGVLGLTLVTADDPTLGFGQDFDTSERLIASRHAELASKGQGLSKLWLPRVVELCVRAIRFSFSELFKKHGYLCECIFDRFP